MNDAFYNKRFGIVWQFDQLGEKSIDQIAATCRQHRIDGVVIKAADGDTWQATFDSSPLGIRSPYVAAATSAALRARGLRVGFWVNVLDFKRVSPSAQAKLHASIAIALGPGAWLALDLEPYPQFLGPWPDGDAIDAYLTELIDTVNGYIGENWTLAMWPDPRWDRLQELRWDRWGWRATCVYAQAYWTDFGRPCPEVLDDAVFALDHHDTRALLPYDGEADFPTALAHPICRRGAGLWRLGSVNAEQLTAFGRKPRKKGR